jgi:hypothetical protein
MKIDLATKSLDSVASLIIDNRNLNHSILIRKITIKAQINKKTNLTIQLKTKFESQNFRVDHSLDTIDVFYYDIASPFQVFSLPLCIDLELVVFNCQ